MYVALKKPVVDEPRTKREKGKMDKGHGETEGPIQRVNVSGVVAVDVSIVYSVYRKRAKWSEAFHLIS